MAGDEGRRGGPARPAAGEGAAPEARARGEERTGGGVRHGGGRCGGGDGVPRRRRSPEARKAAALGEGGGAGARARGGPSWASRAGTAAAMRSRGDTWRRRVGWRRRADDVRPGADTSVGADLAGMFFLGFRGEGEIRKRRGVYIGIEGARRVQMRCGFRPHDRDRTL